MTQEARKRLQPIKTILFCSYTQDPGKYWRTSPAFNLTAGALQTESSQMMNAASNTSCSLNAPAAAVAPVFLRSFSLCTMAPQMKWPLLIVACVYLWSQGRKRPVTPQLAGARDCGQQAHKVSCCSLTKCPAACSDSRQTPRQADAGPRSNRHDTVQQWQQAGSRGEGK